MFEKTDEMILTAGPTISCKEVEFVTDAVANGWNSQWSGYLQKFEKYFCDYVGVPEAMATSSCTGAMHLALMAMGIGEGDEVIVPEITWIATAAAVTYVGAKPVFCDVDPASWTMDPGSVSRLITKRTKAIMPVHIYGHPCDMDPLYDLCEKYNLKIIEDAAQSIGATYKGKLTGSLGDMAAFSFQGAKAVVTGEGGILLGKDKNIFAKARYFGDHGRDPNKTLFNTSIGYKYKMSNMQAALGCAQMLRVDEIVDKKREIFSWYQDRLEDLDCIQLNCEKDWAKNIYWMSSLVLKESSKINRDDFMSKLKARNVDSRPIFHPISGFPMFETVNNPIAYNIGLSGVNLPSGHNLTEEEVDYSCAQVRDILGAQKSSSVKSGTGLWGHLKFKKEVLGLISKIKSEGLQLDFNVNSSEKYKLVALSRPLYKKNSHIAELCMKWRAKNQHAFVDRFEVTLDGTKKWIDNLLNNQKDRVLFMIQDSATDSFIGHIGLFRFNYKELFCEIDNVVRGVESGHKGVMSQASKALEGWARASLGVKSLFLKVLASNRGAIEFYKKLNYFEINRSALYMEEHKNSSHLRNLYVPGYKKPDDYFITMKLES